MTAILAVWQFIRSPLGRYVAMAVAGALLLGAAVLWHARRERTYADALRASWVAEQQAAVAAAVAQARTDGDAAVVAAREAGYAAAQAEAPVREVIRRVPVQSACAASPAVDAALDALRHPIGAGGGAAGASH